MLVGGIARIDQVSGAHSFITAFFNTNVTLHLCDTSRAAAFTERKVGEFLYPPHSREDWEKMCPL
eukprot:6268013-Amphidinium_carterae.1